MRSKRKVSFQDDQQSDESERLTATETVAEGAKRQRHEEEDANQRESRDTGGSRGSSEREEPEDDEQEEEGRSPEALATPEGPSNREREEHNLTHIPYRDWCEHCVRARARKRAHRRRKQELKKEELKRVTRTYMDFFYNGIGEEEEEGRRRRS